MRYTAIEGDTLDEAVANIREAIELYLESVQALQLDPRPVLRERAG